MNGHLTFGVAGSSAAIAGTTVPGHDTNGPQGNRIGSDGNGFPDEGVYVNGKYTSLYAYDANADNL